MAQCHLIQPWRIRLNSIDEARQEYLLLRDNSASVQLATLTPQNTPEASYAPCVWWQNACYLLLSELAGHSHNLRLNPTLSLLLIESDKDMLNAFARRRVVYQGRVEVIERASTLYRTVLAEFRTRFGETIDLIEPLQDFHLFQVMPASGRFIRGFGQAYDLAGDALDELIHIKPVK